MTNLLDQAISCDDGNQAAKIILRALGIESGELANYCVQRRWPTDRKQCARIIGSWIQAEAEFLA
jgi:hypothetical protein